MRSVALDLGARTISYCEVREGVVIARGSVRSLAGLKTLLGPNTPKAQVAFEACREGWHAVELLMSWGHEPLMVDTTRTKAVGIGHHGRKTDPIDAERLALALEAGLLPLAHVLTVHRRELRYQLSVRRALVETRAQYVAQVREIVRARGGRVRSCETEGFVVAFKEATLDEATRRLTEPLMGILGPLEAQLAVVEEKLLQLCAQEPQVERLMTAPGVGLIASAAYVSVIDEPRRFRRAHEVESYLGLVPKEDSSGDRRRLGSISKAGNSYLRSVLVQGAWCVLRMRDGDDPLVRWGHQVAARRGRKVAAVAVARRLAGILWAMWRDGRVYDPALVGHASANGLAARAQAAEVEAAAMRRAARKAAVHQSRARRSAPMTVLS
jgi:transposase